MKMNNTYHYKIKFFIIFLAAVSQAFLVLTSSASYLDTKISTYKILQKQQNSFYRDELDTLCVKIDNLLYVLENSGALKLCSDNSVFASDAETAERFNGIKSNLTNSSLSGRYFSGYYLLGKNKNQLSFSMHENSFTAPGELELHYEKFINDYAVNAFTKNYQKLFLFKKAEFSDIKVDEAIQNDYNRMLDTLDGNIVYFTLEQDVFCLFTVNPDFLETVFSKAGAINASAAIFNSSEDMIYSKNTSKKAVTVNDIDNPGFYTHTSDKYTLVTSSHLTPTPFDLIFLGGMLLFCAAIILWAVHISKAYADKIIEPYRIFKGFFGLNYKSENIEEIDYLDTKASGRNRCDISRNILRALMLAIIIPTALSSGIYMTALNLLSDRFIEIRTSDSHMHLVQRLYDTFDFYLISAGIYDNASGSEQLSRLRYSVTLDENLSLNIQQYDKLNYISSTPFNRQIKQLKNTAADGTLMYIESDLFGDHALASVHKSDDNTYTLNVFKYETMGSIIPDSNTDFMLIDADKHIISQNLSVDEEEKLQIINGDRKKIIHQTRFEDFNWTLYSFSNTSNIKKDIYSTIYMDITAILIFLLLIMIFSWRYSARFMTPLERIKAAMKDETSAGGDNYAEADSNEIEEVLSVYNKMVQHIKKMTEDKIDLVCKEERANALKIRAELNALQQQINPHFLYNTLEMINLSVLKTGDISTSKLVGKLSKIFRYAISSASETVFLYEEIENTKNYMSIWNTRFPDRYSFIWEVDNSLLNTKVLKLIMQPIMENCFFHAFNDTMTGCTVKITICMKGSCLVITVSDNGCGIPQAEIDRLYKRFDDDAPEYGSKGIGIWNVYKRLKLYYGESAGITVTSSENSGTSIQIKFIPE